MPEVATRLYLIDLMIVVAIIEHPSRGRAAYTTGTAAQLPTEPGTGDGTGGTTSAPRSLRALPAPRSGQQLDFQIDEPRGSTTMPVPRRPTASGWLGGHGRATGGDRQVECAVRALRGEMPEGT